MGERVGETIILQCRFTGTSQMSKLLWHINSVSESKHLVCGVQILGQKRKIMNAEY